MANHKDCDLYDTGCLYLNDVGCCPVSCRQYRHKDDVRVVRCKDCKHISFVEGGLALCTLHYIGRAYEDYCSEGERSEGE